MDLSQTTTTYGVDDSSWLGSAHGTGNCRPATLDVSAFTAGVHYTELGTGYFKSGIPLAKITASGLYGPYAGSPSEVQTIAIDATGGTFTASFDGSTTAAVAWNATAATFQAALEALTNLNPGDVAVTKLSNTFTVTFTGQFTGDNVPAMTTNAASLTGGAGTATVVTATAGGSAAVDGLQDGVGFLFGAIPAPLVATTDVAGAIFLHGAVREARLPIAVDAAFKASVGGRIWFV